jgi:N-acetylglucosamine-6-phosphate deacetylase
MSAILGRRYDSTEVCRIHIADGFIADIVPVDGRTVGDAESLPWVAPGLVDLQINGYGGQEFSSANLTAEHVAKIVRGQAAFGVTRMCPTLTTASYDVLSHAMRTIVAACDADGDIDRRILGIHLEGPYISPIDGPRGAHPREHCRPPDWDEFCRLQEAASGRIRLVTLSPEYDDAPDFIQRAVASGVVVSIGHTAAKSDQIRAAADAGATMSTHLGNGAHRELPRHPNYLWDQLADDRLTASLIVDGHHLPPEVVKSFVRAKTPERCVIVSDLSGLAGLPPGRYASELCDLEILDDGRLVIAGQRQLLAGASQPIHIGVANVMRFTGVDLATAVRMASARPAAILGAEAGELKPGGPADLVLFHLRERIEVVATMVGGEVVHGAI